MTATARRGPAGGTDAARDVIHALTDRTRSSMYSGRWLVPNDAAEAPGDYIWRRAHPKEWERPLTRGTGPSLLRALDSVLAVTERLTTPSPPLDIKDTRMSPPRDTVARIEFTFRKPA